MICILFDEKRYVKVMSIFSLVIKNIFQRKVSIALTGFSVALGVALIAATLETRRQVEENFNQSSFGYELILGAKGSALQLVLNTVYQLGDPVGNIPYSTYQKYKQHPAVEYMIPYGLGDNYKGFKIIGTSEDIFTKFAYKPEKQLELANGTAFIGDSAYQAVLGAAVARATGLTVGDKFIATHGLQESFGDVGQQHEHDPMTVVGILKPTYTRIDKAIYCSLPTVWAIHDITEEEQKERDAKNHEEAAIRKEESQALNRTSSSSAVAKKHDHDEKKSSGEKAAAHSHDHDDHDHDAHEHDGKHEHKIPKEGDVTAAIVKMKGGKFGKMLALSFYKEVNSEPLAQVAATTEEVKKFLDIVGNINWAFLFVTALVIVVALVGVAVAIYNSLSERRREIAIMRSLGAHRSKIFSIITLEAAIIAFFGAIFGIVLSKILLFGLKNVLLERTGVELSVEIFNSVEMSLILLVAAVGAVAGILPAFSAYRTDVAKNLSPTS
ncbi:MAG: hypothetical protein HY22_11275 [[Candidatus Thermochlorobacteriaceae] bacterium GBChlB]|nr:MAG: hypothetical protein HY22_11275 [[Candidatus Thermochlorobacteriaceae] bacterium GBChlB]